MDVVDLISWRAVSQLLAGDSTSIRGNFCKREHREKVDKLIEAVKDWKEDAEGLKKYTVDELVEIVKNHEQKQQP